LPFIRLRELFRVGRTSLVIGLVAGASAIALGDFLAALMKGSRFDEIVRESLTIGGWVSMWRALSDWAGCSENTSGFRLREKCFSLDLPFDRTSG
jgi:hypothetical protein